MPDSRKQQPTKVLRPLVEGLECRILYSADAAALGIEAPTSPLDDDAVQVETQLLEEVSHEAKLNAIDAAGEPFHLVVIDTDLEDAEVLREAAEQGGAEVLLFHSEDESAEDVLKRISGVATERGEDFDSISIVSHGSGGQFDLGSDLITQAEAEGSLELWEEVGSHLGAGANLYLYGCNVVDGSGEGQALLDTLAEATGADVFASSDLSGAGGDWDLEAASSGDEAEAAAGLVTPIDASIVESMSSALVDYNESNWSGTQVFNDGAISFTLSYAQGGSIDWTYDGSTNTLSVTDLNGGGPNADFVIIDHNGGLIVDEITVENFRGSLTSDVDIGTLNLGTGNPTSLIVGGGSGSVGTINLTGPVDDSGTIQSNVGTIDITGGGIDDGTTIRVEGDVGDIQVDGDIGVGASLEVTGDLPTLDVTGTVNGQIDIDGDMRSVTVGGDLNGTTDVGGDLPTLTVQGGGDATIIVGGDLDTADWSGDFVGTLTVTNTVGHIDIVDDGVNEYANDFTPPTLVFYDGSANHGTPTPNNAPTADPLSLVMSEDGTAVVTLTGSDIDAGDAIETFRVETLPANGTLYLGTTALTGPTDIPAAQIASNQLTFVPDLDWNGATSFAFSTHDGDDWSASTALVSITVDPVPDLLIDDVPDPDPDPAPDPEPESEVELDPDDSDSEDFSGSSDPGFGDSATPPPDIFASNGESIVGGGTSSGLPGSFSSDAEADDEIDAARAETGFGLDVSETNDQPSVAENGNGPVFAVRRLELDVPPVGYVEDEVSRQVLERIEKDELRVSGFEAASVALSATVVALLSRSASLIAMAVSSIPVWHRFDPLAVVAMSEGSRRAWEQLQKDAEKDEDVDDERLREVLGD